MSAFGYVLSITGTCDNNIGSALITGSGGVQLAVIIMVMLEFLPILTIILSIGTSTRVQLI